MSDKDRNPVRLAEILAQRNAKTDAKGERPVVRRAMPMNGPIIPGGHVSPPHPEPVSPASSETSAVPSEEAKPEKAAFAEEPPSDIASQRSDETDLNHSRAPQALVAEQKTRTRPWAGVLLLLIAAVALYVIYQRGELENAAAPPDDPQVSDLNESTPQPTETVPTTSVAITNDAPPKERDLRFDFAPMPIVAAPAPVPVRDAPPDFGRSAPQALGAALQVPSRPVLEVTPVPPFSPVDEAVEPATVDVPIAESAAPDTEELEPTRAPDATNTNELAIAVDVSPEILAPQPDPASDPIAEAVDLALLQTEETSSQPGADPIPNGPFAAQHRFIIHYNPNSATADQAEEAAAALRDQGAELVEVATVPFGISTTHIRQYHSGDTALADAAQQALGGTAQIRDFTSYTPRPSLGLIEIWLGAS
ncbi:MAG: hypothetical protein AAGF94_05075 [Pseudomonadota bacterium]